MSKFKVGDYVVVTKNIYGNEFLKTGDIAVIFEVYGNAVYIKETPTTSRAPGMYLVKDKFEVMPAKFIKSRLWRTLNEQEPCENFPDPTISHKHRGGVFGQIYRRLHRTCRSLWIFCSRFI